jgi:iron complex outermembrane receptor protein
MVTATLRGDGSSKFGDNHKWGIFPSASAAWRISNEAFMESSRSWLDNLKLRVGYGVTGNQDGIPAYTSLATVGPSGAYFDLASNSWKNAYAPNRNSNPDLKWESTAQTNVGIDISFLRRFNVTVEGYIKKTSDLLYNYAVDPTKYQYPTVLANAGELTNKGVEFTFGANILRTKDFSWNANLTLAYNDQTIDKLSGTWNGDLVESDGSLFGNLHGVQGFSQFYTQILKEGYPVGLFYGPKCSGIDENGHYIFNNRDENGNPVKEYLGSAQPKLNVGFAMDFSYRDFDLGVATYGMFGQKILNAQQMQLAVPGRIPGTNITDDFAKSGITESPVFSDYWIEKGDFFRLQSLTLGYTVPVKNEWFSKIRLYVTGENLFVLTHYTGLDPEVNIDGLKSPGIDKSIGSSDNGDNYFYPRPRTFSFGINLTF